MTIKLNKEVKNTDKLVNFLNSVSLIEKRKLLSLMLYSGSFIIFDLKHNTGYELDDISLSINGQTIQLTVNTGEENTNENINDK